MKNEILHFPDLPHEAEFGASRWQILKTRFQMWLYGLANRLGIPGAVANQRIEDEAIGMTIEIRTGTLFTKITVNGRDFYFWRFSGKYGGTGMGCGVGQSRPYGLVDRSNATEDSIENHGRTTEITS